MNYPHAPILKTERLTLRWLTREDAPFIFALLNDADFIRNIGQRNVGDLETAAAYIEKNIIGAGYKKLGFGNFLIIEKSTGQAVGTSSLVQRAGLGGDIDIGYAMLPDSRGKGYAYEASLAVFQFAKDVLKLPRIVGICDPSNAPSIHLLQKLGLKFEKKMVLNDKETSLYGISF